MHEFAEVGKSPNLGNRFVPLVFLSKSYAFFLKYFLEVGDADTTLDEKTGYMDCCWYTEICHLWQAPKVIWGNVQQVDGCFISRLVGRVVADLEPICSLF